MKDSWKLQWGLGPYNDLLDIEYRPIPYNTNILKSAFGLTSKPIIRKVIYNAPATIIMWEDGSKTVVKCSEDDVYDPMTGFLLCYLKHSLGNDSAAFHRFLKDFGPKPEQYNSADIDLQQAYAKLNSAASKAAVSIGDAAARILDGIAKTFGGSDKEDKK